MKTTIKIISLTVLLLTLSISFLFSKKESDGKSTKMIESLATEVQPQSHQALSEDAAFPSPVIQLQQTVAHGLMASETKKSTLLEGDLSDFSEKNMEGDEPLPSDISRLRLRLDNLEKSIN